MKKLILVLFVLLLGFNSRAQRPKMHLKASMGFHTMSFIYKQTQLSSDFFFGAQGGFGFRVMQKKKVGEVGFNFVRSFVTYQDDSLGGVTVKLNSFQLPFTAGYTTVNRPLFKHFLYGGFVAHCNIKSFLSLDDYPEVASIKIKPSDLFLSNPLFLMRVGTQFDVAMFNIDFNYNLGLNKAFKDNVRTQTHSVHLNLGLIF